MYDLPSKKNGKFVYLPLVGSLYLRDFIKCRPVPLGFIGVSANMIYNDAYRNGVEDFFFHDANHIRRLTVIISFLGRIENRWKQFKRIMSLLRELFCMLSNLASEIKIMSKISRNAC